MRPRRALLLPLACLAVAGCGGGATTADAPPAPAPPTESAPPSPAEPALGRTAYLDGLERYCRTTVGAVERLADTAVDERDPVRPIATFARRYRVALERLAATTPPPALRAIHLLVVAQGRESADRVEDGVRLGRQGDTDAATTALGELDGLLPRSLPASVRGATPSCA